MGSTQQIGILKRDGLGKQHFDMENILTRSLYRVLNNTTQIPPHIAKNQNVDKLAFPEKRTTIAVARPNNHQIGNASALDMDVQMRLLAQEICGRVERKYERKLDEARDRDRRETDKRLNSIRVEYEAKYQLQLGKLEKEKIRLMDAVAERERTLEHRMEMRNAEKEHDLSAKQRTLENRALELTLSKENFEKVRDDWQRKMDGEIEEMRLERERIEVSTAKTTERKRSELSVEAEAKMWKKRSEELEQDADVTRKRIGEMMEENFRLKDQAGTVGQVKRELDVTMNSLNETRDELAASRVEIRRTGDYDRVKDENDELRIEIERLRHRNSQRVEAAVNETIAEYSAKEAKWKRIAGLSQQRIAILSEKLKEIEMERDVLRQEMKTMQKMIGRRGGKSNKTNKTNLIRSISPLGRSTSSSSSSSSLSDGEMEILNIRQRIQNLDDIAKELDASVDHFGAAANRRIFFPSNESNVEMYDDFCRALHHAVLDDEGDQIQKTSSPQKPMVQKKQRESVDSTHTEREERLKRNTRIVSPPTVRKLEGDTPESPKPAIPEMSEFEKRLQARSRAADETDRRKDRLIQLAAEPEEPPKDEEAPKPTSADNPMFSGVDPVMAEYMKKVLATRNEAKNTITPQPVPLSPPKPKEVEVTLADELDLELDRPTAGDDEWW